MIHHLPMRETVAADRPTIAITLKLFAMLERWLPEGARRNEIAIAVPQGTTPAAIIAALDLPVPLCAIVLVDGRFISPEERTARPMVAGEALAIWPPIAGG